MLAGSLWSSDGVVLPLELAGLWAMCMARPCTVERRCGLMASSCSIYYMCVTCAACRSNEDRLHRNLQREGLEIADVVSWEQIPMLDDNETVALTSWPMILPHVLARISVFFSRSMHALNLSRRCYVQPSLNRSPLNFILCI